jgi:O-antigen/teichoic acid export membrane protein
LNAQIAGERGDAAPRIGRRLYSNYLSQLTNSGLRIAEQLLLVPLYLHVWGVELYKDWMLIGAVGSFLITCNFGTEFYFGGHFLVDVARGDMRSFDRNFRTALFCTVSVSVALLALVALALACIDVPTAIQITALDHRTAYAMLIAVCVPVMVLISAQVLHPVYRAFGDFTRGEYVFALYTVAQIGSVAVALFLHAAPLTVALCYLIVPFCFSAALVIDLLRRYPQVHFRLAVPSIDELRSIVPMSLMYFTFPISLALMLNGTLLLFGLLQVSAIAIVTYNSYRIFTGVTQNVANQFAIGCGIEMARQLAKGETAACRRLYAVTGKIVTGLAGLFAGISIPLSGPFVLLWTKGAVGADQPLLIAFLAGIFIGAPGQAALMLFRYGNHPRPLAVAWLGQSVGGLALAYALYPMLGVTGAAIAFSLCQLVFVGLFLPLAVQRMFGFSAVRHLVTSYGVGAAAFALSYAAAVGAFSLGLTGFVGLILTGMVWAAAMALPTFMLLRRTRA